MIERFNSLEKPLFFYNEKSPQSITEKKINRFKEFNNGWSYGNGVRFADETIKTAISVHKIVNDYGFLETDAFPGESGEILITVYEDDIYCEIFVYESQNFDFIIEKLDEEILRDENINYDDFISRLESLRNICISYLSEQSTPTITTKEKEDSRAPHLKTPAGRKMEFQSSTVSALKKLVNVNVNISANSTDLYLANQLSSGNSIYLFS